MSLSQNQVADGEKHKSVVINISPRQITWANETPETSSRMKEVASSIHVVNKTGHFHRTK